MNEKTEQSETTDETTQQPEVADENPQPPPIKTVPPGNPFPSDVFGRAGGLLADDTPPIAEPMEKPAEKQKKTTKAAAAKKSRARTIGIAVGALVLVLAGAAIWWTLIRDDDSTTAEVSEFADQITEDGGVRIVQIPSLRMVEEEGTLYVENDGNVTMSDIEVRDAAGNTVCELGVISPGDREPCEEAGDAQDLTVFGSGPQGQPVEVGLSEQ